MTSLRYSVLAPGTFLAGMLGSLVAAVLVILAMVLVGEYTRTGGRLLLTFLTLAAFCLSAIPPSALLRRGRIQPVGWAGLTPIGIGFVLVTTGIWATPDSDTFWKIAAIASILAALAFHAGWLLLVAIVGTVASQVSRVAMATSALAVLLSVVGIGWEIAQSTYWWPVALLLLVSVSGRVVLLAMGMRLRAAQDG